MAKKNGFFWYELMSSDPAASVAFYETVVGWRPQAWEHGGYTIMNAGDRGVAGIMQIPDEVCAAGGQPHWGGYIWVDDVDAATASIKAAGGSALREPSDIPHVGRFAVLQDPQGASFALLKAQGPDMPEVPPMTPGHVGWHELMTTDWEKAFAFYESQFGWRKDTAMDMGPMGTYQLFADDRAPECGAVGGMMNMPPQIPRAHWGFYFIVDLIDPAIERVTKAGGQIVNGPMEVPGGAWIINAVDPQGAYFSLVGMRR